MDVNDVMQQVETVGKFLLMHAESIAQSCANCTDSISIWISIDDYGEPSVQIDQTVDVGSTEISYGLETKVRSD